MVKEQRTVWHFNGEGLEPTTGHIDGLLFWCLFTDTEGERKIITDDYRNEHHEVALFEHKKMSDFGFKLLAGMKGRSWNYASELENVAREFDGGHVLRGGTLERVQFEYFQQMQCYMSGLRGRNIPVQRGIFVGRNVEAKRILVEVVDYDEISAGLALNHLTECATHYVAGTIPEQDYTPGKKGHWQCDYCDYREACEALGEGIHTIPVPDNG